MDNPSSNRRAAAQPAPANANARAPAKARPVQTPMPPAAGFLAPVEAGEPYPAFPAGKPLLDRMQWARGVPFDNRAARHVLLLLALDAGGAGGIAWTGVSTLAGETGLSRRGVQTGIAWLERCGWLLSRKGRRRSLDRRPKAPGETLCRACWTPDRGGPFCPSWGRTDCSMCAVTAPLCAVTAP